MPVGVLPPEERRQHRRHGLEEHGVVSARIRPGHDVLVVNVSAGGALVETARRLLPGLGIELRVAAQHGRASMRGRVLRSFVARLRPDGVWYRGSIQFDQCLPWFSHEPDCGYLIPGGETGPRQPQRADATHVVL
jgi:hypothetical protein